MNPAIAKHLDAEDDPDLWKVAIETILADLQVVRGMMVEIGRCSHWLRPHQTRWTADGGFAWPTGYGGTAFSRTGLPLFDWSVVLEWAGQEWVVATAKAAKPSLRITIPSRTTRHPQAAIHTLWKVERHHRFIAYGFRKKPAGWQLTAVSQRREERADRRANERRLKARDLQRRSTARP